MKGSVSRPQWPAPEAAKTATRSETTRSTGQAGPHDGSETPIDPSNRITLAVLEETSAAHRAKGYDPYNTSATVQRSPDVWKRKPKRD